MRSNYSSQLHYVNIFMKELFIIGSNHSYCLNAPMLFIKRGQRVVPISTMKGDRPAFQGYPLYRGIQSLLFRLRILST